MNYEIHCKLCLKEGKRTLYIGESGFSSHYRGNFHREGLENRNPDNVLYRHNLDSHPSRTITHKEFIMTAQGHQKLPVLRQSREGVSLSREIEAREAGVRLELINSMLEFHQPGTIKQTFSKLLI